MEKKEFLLAIFACFVLTFFVAFWFDSFILTMVGCGLQTWASAWLVTLFNYKWGTTDNPWFILCFGFGMGCKVLGVMMLLFPLFGFSIFNIFYTLGTMCTLGSLIFLLEFSVHVKINEMVEAEVKTIVNGASDQIKRQSKQLENFCNKYLGDSTWETCTKWYNSDIGSIVQGLCVLLLPKLGLLLLTLTAVVDTGVGTRATIEAVVLGAIGGTGILALVGLAGLGGLGLCCLGGLAALTFRGLGGLGTRFFKGLDGLAFLSVEVLVGLVALNMGGLGGLCALAIGSLGGLAAVTVGQDEPEGVGGKGKFVSSLENLASAPAVLGALGALIAQAMGGLGILGSLTTGALSAVSSQALRGLGGQGKPVSSNKCQNNEHEKTPKDGRTEKKIDGQSKQDKVQHRLIKALHYSMLATVLWYWGPALFLLILKYLLWALFNILRHYPKSFWAIICFIFGAGCTIMGVYLRFLPGFPLVSFSIFFFVGNVFISQSFLLLKDISKQQILFDSSRRVVTSVILSCLVLTLLALFWWRSFELSLTFCVLFILSRLWYLLILWRTEVQ